MRRFPKAKPSRPRGLRPGPRLNPHVGRAGGARGGAGATGGPGVPRAAFASPRGAGAGPPGGRRARRATPVEVERERLARERARASAGAGPGSGASAEEGPATPAGGGESGGLGGDPRAAGQAQLLRTTPRGTTALRPRGAEELAQELREGGYLTKFAYNSASGKPQRRYFVVSADGRELRWGDGRGRGLRPKGRLVLADVDTVLVGRKTPTARSGSTAADDALTFSLVTAERSVDLRTDNAADLDGWVRGLRHLVALAEQQERSSGLGFSFDQGLPASPKIGSPGVAFPLFGKPHERRGRGDDYRADKARGGAKPARGAVAHSSEPPAGPSPYAAKAEQGGGRHPRPASSAKGPATAAGVGGRGGQPASTSVPSHHRLADSPYAQKLEQPYQRPPPGGGGGET